MRRKKNIKARKTFAVVVDGETEVWYLQMLKRNERNINVSIEPKIPQRKKIKKQFENVKKLAKIYDKVFWIIDLDVILKENREASNDGEKPIYEFDRLRQKAEKINNVVVIINNPCLEFWFLLHFESTSRFFRDCASAEKQLKKHIDGYEKSKEFYTKQNNDIYLRLKPHLKTAIAHASKLKSFDIQEFEIAICEMGLFFGAEEFDKYFK